MIARLIARSATLHRHSPSTKDEAGDVGGTFKDVPTFIELQQRTATELRDGMLVRVETSTAFFRPDVVLDSLDEITVDGKRYSMEGDPWLVRNPRTGIASHWQVQLRKVS